MTLQTIKAIDLFGRLCTYLAEDAQQRREVFPLLARADASVSQSSPESPPISSTQSPHQSLPSSSTKSPHPSSFHSSLQRALQNTCRRSSVQAFLENGSVVVEGLADRERVYRVGRSSQGVLYVVTDFPWRNPQGNEIRTLAHTNLYVGHERMLRTTTPVSFHYSPAVELEKTFELDGKRKKLSILVDGRLTVTEDGTHDRNHTQITLERLL